MKKTREEMTQWIQEVVKAGEINCEVTHEEECDCIRMGFRLNNTVSVVNVVIIVNDDHIQSYGFIDNNAGKKVAEVGEFLMRANVWDTGHFSLNYDNGEIWYEFRSPYCAYEKDEDLPILWWLPVERFEVYGDALLKVILGCASPKEAFEECVKKAESEQGEENDQ